MKTRSTFLSDVFTFCARYSLKPTVFGRLTVHDPAFVRRLRQGKPVTLGLIERAEAFMSRIDANPADLPGLLREALNAARQARVAEPGEKRRKAVGGGQ